MPQGAFHYCFASRDELLTEVAAVMLPRELAARPPRRSTRGGSLVDTVHRALLAYWELVEAEPRAHQVIYEITALALRDPALSAPTRARYAGYPRRWPRSSSRSPRSAGSPGTGRSRCWPRRSSPCSTD